MGTDSCLLFPYISNLDLYLPVNSTSPILSNGVESLLTILNLDSQLVSILHGLTNLTHRLASPQEKSAVAPEQEFNLVMSLRYRLLSCRSAKIPSTQAEIVSDACRIDALIYYEVDLLELPLLWATVQNPAGEAQTHLTRLYNNLEKAPIALTELVLWLASIGGILEINPQARTWFVPKLDQAGSVLRLET